MWGVVALWLERQRVNREEQSLCPSVAVSKLGQFRSSHVACVLEITLKHMVVPGVYAMGSRRSQTKMCNLVWTQVSMPWEVEDPKLKCVTWCGLRESRAGDLGPTNI